MPNYRLSIPAENVSTVEPIDFDSMSALLKKNYNKYSNYFKVASENSNIDLSILISFSFSLSGIGENPGTYVDLTKGLIPWNLNFAPSFLKTEYDLQRLNENEKSIFKKYGIKFTKKGTTRVLTRADQLNAELNILIGSIIIGQLLDNIYEGVKDTLIWNSNSDGVLRIDRIYAMYLLTAYQPLEYKLPSEVDKVRKDKSTTPFEFVSFGEKNNLYWYRGVKNLIGKNGFFEIVLKTI